MGFERPLRKQSGGLFLGRGRIHGTQAAAPKSRRQVSFFVLHILWLEAPQNALDPDLTQTGNFSEKCRVDCCLPGFCIFVSECLLQQIPHRCRRLFLYLVGGVGVGGESEACAAVSQHAGHGFYIDSVLQGKGRECVPQIVEADMFQSGILKDLLMELYHRIGVVHSTGHRRGGATQPPPGAEEGRGASGSGRRLSSPLRRAKKTPGTATGNM